MSNMSFSSEVASILTKEDIFAIRDEINAVTISESLEKYIIRAGVCHARPQNKAYRMDDIAPYIQFGVSPRASINLNIAAKAVGVLRSA